MWGGGADSCFVVCGKNNLLVKCRSAASTFCMLLSVLNSGSKFQLNITEPGLDFTTKFEPVLRGAWPRQGAGPNIRPARFQISLSSDLKKRTP